MSELTEEKLYEVMGQLEAAEKRNKNYRWMMKRYHKNNPIYRFYKWRGNRRQYRLNDLVEKSLKANSEQVKSANPTTHRKETKSK